MLVMIKFSIDILLNLSELIVINLFQIILIIILLIFGYFNKGFVLNHSEYH